MVDDAIRVDARKVVVDVALVVLMQSLVIIIPMYAVPVDTAFSCQDTTLMYPYVESTISRRTIMVLAPCLGCLVLGLLEWFSPSSNRKVLVGKSRVPTFAYNVYSTAGAYLFGLCAVQVIVTALLYIVGRPRPYFLTFCRPDVCLGSNGSEPSGYFRTFTCTNPSYEFDELDLSLMRTSFPSGHATLGAFCSVYLGIYFQKKVTSRVSKLLKHVLQLAVILLGLYIAVNRLSDHKHHWGDVLAGTFIGAVCAVLTAEYLATPSEDYQPAKLIQ